MTTSTNRAKRPKIIKLSLAGVAVLGIGAALTSAAWLDDAWFTGTATAGAVELEGRAAAVEPADENEWIDADDAGTAVVIPEEHLADLVPNEAREFGIELRNASTVPLHVTLDPETGIIADGELLDGTHGTAITTDWNNQELAPGDEVAVSVTVTAGDYPEAVQDATDGTLTLTFQGSTDLP